MTVEITENTISKEIKGLKGAAPKAVRELVQSLTRETHRIAVRRIQAQKSGRLYQKYNPRREHRASAPGEYPASDTGRLASSIQFELPIVGDPKPEGIVGTNLQYGKHLELKPTTRGGRPWLMPAFNEATAKAEDMLARIFKRMNKKGGR